jgi:hypothetical protein
MGVIYQRYGLILESRTRVRFQYRPTLMILINYGFGSSLLPTRLLRYV